MDCVLTASKLLFFKAEKYSYDKYNSFDTSTCPRPHFCMGLVINGEGTYKDCSNDRIIRVKAGDIIFVPVASRYISEWIGNPEINYISIHFTFEKSCVFSRNRKYSIQKITPTNFDKIYYDFQWILENYDSDENKQLLTLSKFYEILGEILPDLKSSVAAPVDLRLTDSLEYIENNFNNEITAEALARISNMSISRFFACFKKSIGVTPIEYINNYRVNRAIIMLINGSNLTVEEISEATGFQSATYFRRVFKKITGKTPREYKSMGIEI